MYRRLCQSGECRFGPMPQVRRRWLIGSRLLTFNPESALSPRLGLVVVQPRIHPHHLQPQSPPVLVVSILQKLLELGGSNVVLLELYGQYASNDFVAMLQQLTRETNADGGAAKRDEPDSRLVVEGELR